MREEYFRPHLLYDQEPVYEPSGQCDCGGGDCACSLPNLSFPLNSTSSFDWALNKQKFGRSPGSDMLDVVDNYAICYGPYHKPTVLNAEARKLLRFFDAPKSPKRLPGVWREAWGDSLEEALREMVEIRLLLEEGQGEPRLIEEPKTLAAWLHVTDRCNLRCDYCYLPHWRKDMSMEVGRKAIDAIFRSATINRFSKVKLKYAGGEALLRFPFVVELHRYAQEMANASGMALDAVVLTNGTLLSEEILEDIRALGLRVMVSLDGLGEYHDTQRHYASGRGSFEAVSRGVALAQAYGVVPDVSVTVSGRNAAGLPEVVAWILERELPFSLNFYRENELSASFADLQLEEATIIEGMLAAYKVIEENLPRRSLLASLVDRANLSASHLRTCGVGHSYLVFDYRGRVSKCQMQLMQFNQAVTTVDAEDPLALIRADTLGIQNLSVEEKEGCRDCEWKYWCTGGCSLATFKATGRYDIKSPNCKIYKALYPEAMRLEGLRLLKYG